MNKCRERYDPDLSYRATIKGQSPLQAKQFGLRVRRGARLIVTEAIDQRAWIQFVIDQMTDSVLKSTGNQLAGKVDGQKRQPRIDSLVTGDPGIASG